MKPLPKKIRNDLTLCCAMKACNTLALGKPKRVKDQHKAMATFFHGHPPNHPNQIKLLCSASFTHKRLFDATSSVATKKKDNSSSASSITLKTELSRDKNRTCHSETDINSLDLEKKFRTNPQLISGRKSHGAVNEGQIPMKRHYLLQLTNGI